MMHGFDYLTGDLTGWIVTEKMDGCRLYWDGRTATTKSGRPYRGMPAALRASLPDGVALDCELWIPGAHRGASLAAAAAAALRGAWAPGLAITPFDLPEHRSAANERIGALHRIAPSIAAPFRIASSTAQALDWRAEALAAGREGLMALDPAGLYMPGRRPCLLKLKAQT